MLQAADLRAADLVVEIGPGRGILTKPLCRQAGFVVAIEIDRRLAAELPPRIGGPGNLMVVEADVLRSDLPRILDEGRKEWTRRFGLEAGAEIAPFKLVANLPFYLTAPLLQRLQEAAGLFDRMVLMVQLEVAERLLAAPGDPQYGALTVGLQYRFDIRWLGRVPAKAFRPQPKVDAGCVLLVPRREELSNVGSEADFRFVVQAAFGQRRKTLREALGRAIAAREDVARAEGRGRAESILAGAGIELDRRGETLSVEEFAALSRVLHERREASPT